MPSTSSTPRPRFVPFQEFGCPACRDAIGLDRFGNRAIPPPFVPIAERLGRATRAWTRPFMACTECDAIWVLLFDPKDLIYVQTPTPFGTARALRPEAQLADLMPLLFAWAPVDELAERALSELAYEPQDLWDRLTDAWRDPSVETARRADILRQLARLLEPQNPNHRRLHDQRGWLLHSRRDFDRDLTDLERTLATSDLAWRPFAPRAAEHLQTIQDRLESRDVVREPSTQALPHLPSPSMRQRRGPSNAGRETKPTISISAPTLPKEPVVALGRPSAAADGSTEAETGRRSALARTLELLWPAWRFLPACTVGWIFLERIAAPGDRAAASPADALFFCVVLVLTGSAVAANAGLSDAGLGRIVWRRMSVLGDYLLAALLLVGLLLAAVGLGLTVDSDPDGRWFIGTLSLATAVAFSRLWPFWIVPYMQPIDDDLVSHRSPGIPRRVSFATAWRLTGQRGTFATYTLPWFAAVGAAVAIVLASTQLFGAAGRMLTLYPVVLPLLTAFTWALVEAMPDQELAV